MTIDTDKLKALALAATKGPWIRLFGERTVYDRTNDGCRGNAIVRADVGFSQRDADNLDFIAALDPATVLELIAEVERLRAEVKEWLCIDCNTVYPGPPQPGFACVVCPKCGGSTGPRLAMENRLLRAAPAAGTEKDAERLAEGYESGFFASDPRDGDGQFTLHYKTAAQAEAAYMLVTSIIDAAIEAHSKAGKEHA